MKLLVVCNNAPLYRKGIFSLIDQTYNCDWLFGEAIGDIKKFDLSLLRGKVTVVKRISMLSGKAYWQEGVIKQLFKGYSHYILLGEERCFSTWIFALLALFFPKKKVYFWTHDPYGRENRFPEEIREALEKIQWWSLPEENLKEKIELFTKENMILKDLLTLLEGGRLIMALQPQFLKEAV